MTSLIGRRLGRYELRAELGRGGMARVYRASDLLLQRQVAVKVLAPQLSLDEEFVRRFEREATTAANLRHPAIVTIYDVGEQDGLHYIAMECVDGRSLHYILEERTTLGLGYAISLLDPVARALDYAHEQGAIHRDIKPHNILVDRDGRVLLTDFGIAQTPDSDGERLTRTGVFMGTPEYISPEQAEARRVDGRSDLYSLAVVAYEVITGRVPFSGATPQLIVAHSQLPPPPPTSVLAHLPSELDEVLTRALAKRAERRYQTGGALIEALRAIASRYGVPAATREQLAGLATATGAVPAPRLPEPIPGPPPRPRPQQAPPQPAPPRPAPAAPSSAGQQTVRERSSAPQPVPAPRPQTGARAQTSNGAARPPQGPSRPLRNDTTRANPLPIMVIGGLLVAVTVALLVAVAQGLASPGRPLPTVTVPPPTLTLTAPPPTAPPTGAPGLVATMLPATPTATLLASPSPVPATQAPTRPPPEPTRQPTRPPQPTLAPPQPTSELPTLTPAEILTVTPAESPSVTVEPPSATPEQPSLTPEPTATTTITPTLAPTLTPTAEQTPILGTPVVQTPIVPGGTP